MAEHRGGGWSPRSLGVHSASLVSDADDPLVKMGTSSKATDSHWFGPVYFWEPLRAIQTTLWKASVCLRWKGNRRIKYFPVELHEWCWHWGLCSGCMMTFQGQSKMTILRTWPLVRMDLHINILRACLVLKSYVFRSVPLFLIGCVE